MEQNNAPTAEPESASSKKRPIEDDKDDDDDNNNNDDSNSYRRLSVYGDHKRAVSSVKFAPSRLVQKSNSNSSQYPAALVASASADSFLKVWDLSSSSSSSSNSSSCAADDGGIISEEAAAAASNSSCFVSKPPDQERTLLQPCTVCVGHSRGINEIAWNPCAPLLASASDDKTVRLWDAAVTTGDSLVEFKGHDNFVFCVDQHHAMIVSGSFDETVKLWDIRSGDCVSTIPAHSDPVTAVSFNRDGTCVCSASHDGLIRIWDVATGECLKTIFAAGNPPVSSVKYSPNSKYLLAGTLDSCIRLWPVNQTGSHCCSKTYKSTHHVNTKYSIASDFMHDGNIVTGSETGDVVIYELQSRQVLNVLKGHDDAVLAVSAHDKFPLLSSGGMTADRKVEFWVKDNIGSEPSSSSAAAAPPARKKQSQ